MGLSTKKEIHQTVQNLKSNNQDFEFYPTTKEILDVICKDMLNTFVATSRKKYFKSDDIENGFFLERCRESHIKILDIGAGNGDSLNYLAKFMNGIKFSDIFYHSNNLETEYDKRTSSPKVTKYAIEKSSIMSQPYKHNKINFVGADYDEVNINQKKYDVIFCNPPYSNYKTWMIKTLNSAYGNPIIYFVIPSNWKNDTILIEEINKKFKDKIKLNVINNFDFSNGSRAARVNVDVVKIDVIEELNGSIDFIKALFEKNKFSNNNDKNILLENENNYTENELINTNQKDYASFLVEEYNKEIDTLYTSINSLSLVPIEHLTKLFNFDYKSIVENYNNLINEIKHNYWKKIIHKTSVVEKKLIKKYRDSVINEIIDTSLDFTLSNIYSIIARLLYLVNENMNEQILIVYNDLIKNSPTEKYKSNHKFFVEQKTELKDEFVKLTQRIILEMGYFSNGALDSNYKGELSGKLTPNAANKILDLIIVIESLGYKIGFNPFNNEWKRGKITKINGVSLTNNNDIEIMEVKVFQNGNIHIKLNKKILEKLNIIKGLLDGWITNVNEITDEFDVDENTAIEMINIKNNGFVSNNLLLLK